MVRSGGRVAISVAAIGTLVGALLLATARTEGRAATTPLVVTLANAKLTVSRSSIPVGTAVFSVTNRARTARTFTVAGKRTVPIAPGRKATLRVVFGKGGSYGLVSIGVRSKATARLRVISAPTAAVAGSALGSTSPPPPAAGAPATCPHPVATTVTVTMNDGFFTFSQTSLPCGAVTFVTTNVGTLEHSVVLGSGARPGVNPGQTASFTANLAPGDVHWECGTFGHDDLGEEGTLVVSG